jgi:hypothetical protein
VRKRPEIPEDVFFDTAPAREEPEPEPAPEPEPQPEASEAEEPQPEPDDVPRGEVLAKSMGESSERTHVRPSEVLAERDRKRAEAKKRRERREREQREEEQEEQTSRVGRPPAQEGPKVAVTLYLTEPVAHLLEEVKFRLLTEYDVKTSKSAVADFAVRNGLESLEDLEAAADDLRRD